MVEQARNQELDMTSQPEQPKAENFTVTVTAQYIKDFFL